MAYNTRRSGPPGMGRGSNPMYQQRGPAMRSPSYNTPNPRAMQTGNFGHSQHQTQSQQNNSSSNYSQQQQHAPPPQQQQQQQQQPQAQHQGPPPSQQHQGPPPAIKQEKETPPTPPQKAPPAPVPTPMVTEHIPPPPPVPELKIVGDADSEDGVDIKPKPWLKKKVPGFKVNKKVKRRRQNARLRKILQPKNAIMVLNELKTGIKFSFQEHTNALTQTMFVVNAEVDGKTYTGQGLSKPLAKQNAAENALKDLLLQKMADAAMKVISEGGDVPEPMVSEINSLVAETESLDGSEVGKPGAPEDDVPWGSLASFALYKLFTEWQSQGTHVPITKTPAASPTSQPAKATAPAPMKKIPDNPTERHPVMLLNQLRPGVEFKEVSREGMPPNLIFTLSVSVDGATYTGVAKNKKDAKKEAAKAALAGSFNIHYD